MKTLLALIVLIILAGGGYYWYAQSGAMPTTTPDDMNGMDMNTDSDAMPNNNTSTGIGVDIGVDGSVSTGEMREITVSNNGMTFNPKTLSVKKGDRVKITFNNTGGTHDLRVEGYDVGTRVIQGGNSESFEFVADEAGSFEYYCSVGNHRAMGMWGTLTVTE